MNKTREYITLLSKKESSIKKLVKQFQRNEITEDELIVNTISYLSSELNAYRDEEERIDLITW